MLKVLKEDDGVTYAMKIIDKLAMKEAELWDRTKAEEALHTQTGNHKYIVNVRYVFETERKLHIGATSSCLSFNRIIASLSVSDYVGGGDLFFLLREHKKLPEQAVRLLMAEIWVAISFLHSLNIVYR